MDTGLRNEYTDWYNQYNYASVGLPTKVKDPEYDEAAYTEKLISPVADILGIALQSVTLGDVVTVLKYVQQRKFHFFWRVADLVAKFATKIPPEHRREKMDIPFDNFLKGHTAYYIMTKGGEPVIGYAKKHGDLVGVDPNSFARLGAVSRIRSSLTNIKGILSTQPSRMSDVNRKMVKEMNRVGILTTRSLQTEMYPIPDKKGGVKDKKVTVLSPDLPPYAVCSLILVLPEAIKNEYKNVYEAALEYAKTSTDPKYANLVPELKLLVGQGDSGGSSSLDAELKALGYTDKMIESIKAKEVASRSDLECAFTSAGFDMGSIIPFLQGNINGEDLLTNMIMDIKKLDAEDARALLDGNGSQSQSNTVDSTIDTIVNAMQLPSGISTGVKANMLDIVNNECNDDTIDQLNLMLKEHYSAGESDLSDERAQEAANSLVSKYTPIVAEKVQNELHLDREGSVELVAFFGRELSGQKSNSPMSLMDHIREHTKAQSFVSEYTGFDINTVNEIFDYATREDKQESKIYEDAFNKGKGEVTAQLNITAQYDSGKRTLEELAPLNRRNYPMFTEAFQREITAAGFNDTDSITSKFWDMVETSGKSQQVEAFVRAVDKKNDSTSSNEVSKLSNIISSGGDILSTEIGKKLQSHIARDLLQFYGVSGENMLNDYINRVENPQRLYTEADIVVVLTSAGLTMSMSEAIMTAKSKSLKHVIIGEYLKSMGITEITKEGGIRWDAVSDNDFSNDGAYQIAEKILIYLRTNINANAGLEFRMKVQPLQRILLPAFFAAPTGLDVVETVCKGLLDEVMDDEVRRIITECQEIAMA